MNQAKLNNRVTRVQNVANIEKAATDPIRYVLGHGGFHPEDLLPSRDGECDCSGFVSHSLMLSRVPKPTRPWYLSTENIYRDATIAHKTFIKVPRPFPGCVVVYYAHPYGHCGIITSVTFNKQGVIVGLRGVDCSHGSDRVLGRAIVERDLVFFLRYGGIFCVLREDYI